MSEETNYRGIVYPWQCDHIGHLNIMWYVSKFDEANWNFFGRLGVTPEFMRETGCDAVGVNQELSYQLEMYPGDLVEITTGVIRIGERSMRFRHEMRNAGTGKLAATCVMTAAYLDRRTGRSTPWPPEVRQAAEERPQTEDAAS